MTRNKLFLGLDAFRAFLKVVLCNVNRQRNTTDPHYFWDGESESAMTSIGILHLTPSFSASVTAGNYKKSPTQLATLVRC